MTSRTGWRQSLDSALAHGDVGCIVEDLKIEAEADDQSGRGGHPCDRKECTGLQGVCPRCHGHRAE